MISLRQVGIGHSFFSFIEEYCPSEKLSANWAIHRLCSLMRKMGAETAIIESTDENIPEIRAEYAALRDRYEGSPIHINSFRITFVSEEITRVEEINKIHDSHFLANAIIINFDTNGSLRSYVFKAIIALPGIKKNIEANSQQWVRFCKRIVKLFGGKQKSDRDLLFNNYIHVYKTFICEIKISESRIHKFDIVGTFFSQQNNSTSVCGHAALCMVINNMPTYTGELVTTEHINSVLKIDHKNIKLGSPVGLSFDNIRTTLKSFGLNYNETDIESYPMFEYDDIIHKYLESGYPSLLIFRTTKDILHVVSVLGHTLNTDLWRPEAEYAYRPPLFPTDEIAARPASEWVDNLIIHDDNFGMYQCLQTDSLKRTTDIKNDPEFRVVHVVNIIPDNAKTFAYEAEYASVRIIKEFLLGQRQTTMVASDWLTRLLLSDSLHKISVTRTMLVMKADYFRSLSTPDFEGNSFNAKEKEELIKDLPGLFWLSEITLPDLYTANKTKLVDFFYPADLPLFSDLNDIYTRWIQARFPKALVKRTASGGESIYPMSVSSHYPLFRLPNQEIRPEW